MRVSDIGEFPLIERIRSIVALERDDVVVGLGDDAAVLRDPAGAGESYLLATVDSHVENTHFLPFLTTPRQLGRRALVVNLSDIAAMGGQATFALVSLMLPGSTDVGWVEEVYRGMRAEADHFGTAVIGGNITRSPGPAIIDITVLGRVQREHLLLRSGARPGDKLLVTDRVGDAYTGLNLVFNPRLPVEPTLRERLIMRYMEPQVRLPEAAVIARSGLATAMIDVSDGLSSDIGHICESSGVGVRVYAGQVPVTPEARQVADAMEASLWKLIFQGGDDYGLCFTAQPDGVDDLIAAVARETGTRVSIIGEVVPAEQGSTLVLPEGQEVPLEATGWQHFEAET